ncbi:MAG: isopentenyl-diphosphate Delta-isomerase [Flavobacteriales bacterium]
MTEAGQDHVILVDEEDRELGTMEKMAAHEQGVLHRAFSIFVFNAKNELLIHKRAKSKYHSGGLWTNTCCSHPRLGETVLKAAHRRLQEEMGMETDLVSQFTFIYFQELDKGLTEHELDHVLFGKSDAQPQPNPDEVEAWRYISFSQLQEEMTNSPDDFTAWFKICFEAVAERWSP